MHILHVIDSLALGGAERMLVDIANATTLNGHQVSVCVTRTSRLDLASDLNPRIELCVLQRAKRFDFIALRQYSDFVKTNNFDIVHVHGLSSFSFCVLANTLYPNSSPIVLHDHNSLEVDDHIPLWFRIWGRRYVKKFIGVYAKLADWAKTAGIGSNNVNVIGNGIDLTRLNTETPANLRQQYGIDIDDLVGIVVAGLRSAKGIDLLIESLSKCAETGLKIIIVGGSRDPVYVEKCRELAVRKNVERHLTFLGERRDVQRLIRGSDFALVPSRSESGPLVLIEYLAAGLPIVAFRVGDVAHAAAAHGIEGFVEPNDIDTFAAEISKLLALSAQQRQQRGKLGTAVAIDVFSIQSKLAAIYAVYNQAMKAQ